MKDFQIEKICVCLYTNCVFPTFTVFQIVLIPLNVTYLSLSRRTRRTGTWRSMYARVRVCM